MTVTHPRACWLFLAVVLASCQDSLPQPAPDPEGAPSQEPAPAPGALTVGPERTIRGIADPAIAFRQVGSGFGAKVAAHDVVVRDGIVDFSPYTFAGGLRRGHRGVALETTSIAVDGGVIASAVDAASLVDGQVTLRRGDVREQLWNDVLGLHQEWMFDSSPGLDGDLTVEIAVAGYAFTSATKSGLHFMGTDGVGMRYSHAVWVSADGKEWPVPATFDDDRGQIRLTVPQSVLAETTFPALLDPTVSGEVLTDDPVAGSTGANATQAAIAYGGGNYLAVWTDVRESASSDIWGTRISPAGAVLDAGGIRIASAAGVQQNPSVAFSGTEFVVAYESGTGIAASTVTTGGVVTDWGTLSAAGTRPVVAALGANQLAMIAYNNAGSIDTIPFNGSFGGPQTVATGATVERPGIAGNAAANAYVLAFSKATDLIGIRITPSGGATGVEYPISAAAGSQISPTMTTTPTGFAVVWTNNSAGINLYGTALDTTGAVLNTRVESTVTVGGVAVSTAASNQEFSSLACQASGCMVLWQDRRNQVTTNYDVYGQLINLDFSLSGTEFVVSNASERQLSPAIAASGTGFQGTWQDLRDGAAYAIYGVPASSTGVLGTTITVNTGSNRESAPSLGRVGTTTAVVWSDSRGTAGADLYFARFNSTNTKLDATALVASNAAFAQGSPSASTDLGTQSLVVWSDSRSGATNDIYGTLLDLGTGTSLTPAGVPISTATNDQLVPDVASNGTVALAVWQDRRNGGFDIYGALVNAAGAVTVADIVISNATGDQGRPSVAWDPASSSFIVVWADLRDGTTFQIFGSRVSSAGATLDPAGVQISSAATGGGLTPSLASSPTGSFAVWQDRRDAPAQGYHVYGTRLTATSGLTVLDPAGIKLSSPATGNQSQPQIALIGSSYVTVWTDTRNTQTDIYGQQLTTAGALLGGEFAVANSTDSESAPTLLANGTNAQVRIAYEVARLSTSRIASRYIVSAITNGTTCSGPTQCASGFCVDGKCCASACGGGILTDCQACNNARTNQPDGVCAPLPATTICREYASTYCDLREYCTGSTSDCPADTGRRQGLTCSLTTNRPAGTGSGICPANAAPGPHSCL